MLGLWRRSDNKSVASHRKLVDAINMLGNVQPTGDIFVESSPYGTGVLDKRRPWDDEYKEGIIVAAGPDGQADYGDERYWVQTADYNALQNDQTDNVRTDKSPQVNVYTGGTGVPLPYILTVTNRQEILPSGEGTHSLPVGKWVRYRPVFDGDQQVRYVMEEPPDALLGVIVCHGPCGEEDFPDWRYWVAFIDATNTGGDKTEAPDLKVAYRYPPPDCGGSSSSAVKRPSKFAKIIQAANFNEFDCDTHLVRPGTPVRLEWTPDHSTPVLEKWFFQVADLTTCFPECKEGHCCRCYQVKYSLDPGIQPIRMYQMGSSKNWMSSDGASSLMLYGGKWNLTLFDGTIYTAKATSPCPPLDLESWVLESGSTSLASFDCCEPSSSSSSSSGACCDCYQVDFQGNSYQLNQAADDKWTSDDDTVFIEGDGSGNWTLTITSGAGRGVWYATGPCPPEGMEAWGGTTGHDFPTVSCCSPSSSSSSSSSGSSSSGSSGSSSSGPCTPICGIRYNTSTKCFEYTTDGATWHPVENACASPCGTTGGG